MKRNSSLWFILYSSFSIVGAIVGVGFVSGKEIVSFFYKYQPISSYIVLFTCVIFLVCLYNGLINNYHYKKRKINNIKLKNDVIMPNYENNLQFLKFDKFKKCVLIIMEMLVASTMLGGARVLIQTAGFKNELLNIVFMIMLINLIAILCVRYKNMLTKISGIMSILLFAVMVINLGVSIDGGSVCNDYSNSINFSFVFAGVSSGIFYASMNMLSCVGIISLTKNIIKSRVQAFLIAFISAVTILLLIILILLVYSKNQNIINFDMPLLVLARNTKTWFYYIYFAIIAGGCLSSLVSVACSVFESLKDFGIGVTHYKAVLLLLISYLISLVGFEFLIEFIYPLIGMLYLILGVFTFFMKGVLSIKNAKMS